jgi:hypothetical protein
MSKGKQGLAKAFEYQRGVFRKVMRRSGWLDQDFGDGRCARIASCGVDLQQRLTTSLLFEQCCTSKHMSLF